MPQLLKRRIKQYKNTLKVGEKFKIIFGGHWSNNPGWLVVSESEQDITKSLSFSENIADVIFTEHVIEHVSFMEGVAFMRNSKRTLKEL